MATGAIAQNQLLKLKPWQALETRLNNQVLRRPGYEQQGARPFLSTRTVQLCRIG